MRSRCNTARLGFAGLACALLAPPAIVPGAPMDVLLGFSSLPSAQNRAYSASGAHAGVLESSIFSVGSGVLVQNAMGQSTGVSGGGILYQIAVGITTTEAKQIIVRAR